MGPLAASEIDKLFNPKESFVYTSDYPENTSDNYPKDITKSYRGLKNTIADKIYDIFYVGNFTKTKRLNIQNITYSYIIENSYLIDTYSLDKSFNTSKLPKKFQSLIKKPTKKQ